MDNRSNLGYFSGITGAVSVSLLGASPLSKALLYCVSIVVVPVLMLR